MKLNQKGFSLVEGLLIVIALAMVGGVGYYVYDANNKSNKQQAESSIQKQEKKAAEKKDEYQDWNTYTNKEFNYTLRYPADWEFKAKKQVDTNFEGGPVYDNPDSFSPKGKAEQIAVYVESGKTSHTDPEQYWKKEGSGRANEPVESKSLKINGYAAYFVKTSVRNEFLYIYSILGNGVGVNINAHPTNGDTSVLDVQKKIVNSIKFN